MKMNEQPFEIHGVPGTMTRYHAPPTDKLPRRLIQTWKSEARGIPDSNPSARMRVTIRFDDQCKNGHSTFSVTGWGRDAFGGQFGGCCHDEIAKTFPELEHLIKWHLVSEDGPLHYVANARFLAGDRDHNGYRKGEPDWFSTAIKFGDFPITQRVKDRFWHWLKDARLSDLSIEAVEHKGDDRFDFAPKYKPAGYEAQWHECPWDSFNEAGEMVVALRDYEVEFIKVPTHYSEGKERELDAARSVAVWPEATDEELCQEPEDLEEALKARLPALLERFRADIKAAGLVWDVEELAA